MLEIVHGSWFMLLRRLYLTYNVCVAALLVMMQGFSFGIQLFYKFRMVERNPTFSPFGVMMSQISIIAKLILMSLICSLVLAKCVAFGKMIWRPEQFTVIAHKVCRFLFLTQESSPIAHRIISLFIQFAFYLLLEITPIILAIIFLFIYLDFRFAIQVWLAAGVVFTVFIVIAWWLGSIIENYKRLIVFFIQRSHKVHGSSRSSGKDETRPIFSSQQSTNTLSTMGSSSSLSSLQDVTPIDVKKSDEADHFLFKESNLWVLVYYFCCIADIFAPLHKLRDFKSRTSSKEDDEKVTTVEQEEKAKKNKRALAALRIKLKMFSIRARSVWIGLGLLILVLIDLAMLRVVKLFAVTAVISVCIVLNQFLVRFSFIPRHKPKKDRLVSSWKSFNPFERFTSTLEEVFYLSPRVVFNALKLILFFLSFFIAVALIFNFSITALIFLVPLGSTVFLLVLYILRFNLNPCIKVIQTCFGKAKGAKNAKTLYEEDDDSTSTHEASNLEPNILQTGEISPLMISPVAKSEKLQSASFHPHENRILRVLSILCLFLALVFGIFIILVITIIWQGWLSFLVFVAMLLSTCFIVFMRYDYEIAASLQAFFLFFILLLGGILFVGTVQFANTTYSKATGQTGVIISANNGTAPYSICDSNWNGFNVVDFAFFSRLAYEPEPYFYQDLQTWFPQLVKEGARIVKRENSTVYFYDLFIPSRNLSIIGVKGTSELIDAVQDVDLWKESGLLQLAGFVGPFTNIWPDSFSRWIVYAVDQIERLGTMGSDYYSADSRYYYAILDKYMQQIQGTRNIILTGHSLGGGLAKIAGIKYHSKAITFAAPGVGYSAMKLGLNIGDINRYSVSIIPKNDIVHKADIDYGLIQQTDCEGNFVDCHLLTNTIQDLIRSCGSDPLGRWIDNGETKANSFTTNYGTWNHQS